MKLIAHRGNLDGPNLNRENSPDYIDAAINSGFDVEIDLRVVNGELFLGHDFPEYHITKEWLYTRRYRLWIHCKDYAALLYMTEMHKFDDYMFFYHETEDHTIISNGMIWSHDFYDVEINKNNIIPLLDMKSLSSYSGKWKMGGVCTDYVNMCVEIVKVHGVL